MTIAPSTLGDLIERNAAFFPAKTAVVFEGKRPSFAQFASRVRKLARSEPAFGSEKPWHHQSSDARMRGK